MNKSDEIDLRNSITNLTTISTQLVLFVHIIVCDIVMVWFSCRVLLTGKLLHQVKLPNLPATRCAVCVGPGNTVMVASHTELCIWIYSWDLKLVQTIGAEELVLEKVQGYHDEGYSGIFLGVGYDNGRLLLHVWHACARRRLYSYSMNMLC